PIVASAPRPGPRAGRIAVREHARRRFGAPAPGQGRPSGLSAVAVSRRCRPKWRNGRRSGFKIRRGNPSCEFESHLRHKVKTAATALFSGFRGWGLWAIPWAILLVLVTCACDARFYVAESGAGGAGGEGGMGGAALGGAAGAVAEADGMAGAEPEP